MLLKKLMESICRPVHMALLRINFGKIDVGLVKCGRHANASLKGFRAQVGPICVEIKNAEIVQSLRIFRAQPERRAEELLRTLRITLLGESESQIVINLGVVRIGFERPLQYGFRLS